MTEPGRTRLMRSTRPVSQPTPVVYVDDYLPLEDYGLIGDGTTAALVGRDGAIAWLCLPRFDSAPVFCSILDAKRGGNLIVAPEGLTASAQRYEPDSGVLVTEMLCPTGRLQVTDCLLLRAGADLSEPVPAGRGEILRSVHVQDGSVVLHMRLSPRGGATAERRGDGLRIRYPSRPDLDLQLFATRPLVGLQSEYTLQAGERLEIVLRWAHGQHRRLIDDPGQCLAATLDAWRRWSGQLSYTGPQQRLVRRSAITLKLLDYVDTGAILAAPTSSLPEMIGGRRNWDYRYAWIRDTAFSVYALRRVGLDREAWGFLEWALDAIDRGGRPRVLYTVDGRAPQAEEIDPELEGYRRSAPVRWGNAAFEQAQHDVYGEILDCAYLWAIGGGAIDSTLWARLARLVEAARRDWLTPDQGVWEVRTAGRPFTYSAAMCQVALDRGARLAGRFGLPGDRIGWSRAAQEIRDAILDRAWDAGRGALVEHLGGGGLDASLLALPLRRVLPADHPPMIATTAAISAGLDAGGGLLYRYLPAQSPDGLSGVEGAFLLCSFWLVDNLALQGRMDEAHDLYSSICARANPLGLLSEQIDPGSGAFLGNYPQAFSHIGLISSGVNLARLAGGAPDRDLGRLLMLPDRSTVGRLPQRSPRRTDA